MEKLSRINTYEWEALGGKIKITWCKKFHQQGGNFYLVEIEGKKKTFFTQKEALGYAKTFINKTKVL